MKSLKHITLITLICLGQMLIAQTKTEVKPFHKAIISPHIETIFVQGDEESVTIVENTLSDDIVNIEVKNKTLRVYLDDAKTTTKTKKVKIDGYKRKMPIYKGKVLSIKVVYKNLNDLSLRGEQKTVCKSLIDTNNFKLKIYGESQVTFNDIDIKDFDATIYGESELTIKNGTTNTQKITAYGEGEINMVEVKNKTSKLKAYGEAEFTINSSDHIKFTAYGEAELHYKGTASVSQGLSIGDSKVKQI